MCSVLFFVEMATGSSKFVESHEIIPEKDCMLAVLIQLYRSSSVAFPGRLFLKGHFYMNDSSI